MTDKGNNDLFVAHSSLYAIINSNKNLRKAEKLDKLSAKNLLTVGYSEQLGYDFMYQVQGGYIHVLVRRFDVTFVYISVSGTTYFRTYFKQHKGVNFLARDGYLYVSKVVEVNAKSMKERKS